MTDHRMSFVSDALVQQIIDGTKTASCEWIHRQLVECEEDSPLLVGRRYTVIDSTGAARCRVLVTGIELATWDRIPDRLWRGEGNASADEFRDDHLGYFRNPPEDFAFVAYYFMRLDDEPAGADEESRSAAHDATAPA